MVEHEGQLRHEPEVSPGADLVAEVPLRVLEGGHRRARLLLVAENAHVDSRAAQIVRHLDRGDRGKRDARIAELLADERSELALQQRVHTVRPLVRHDDQRGFGWTT